jgi:putative heme-binding domain-containing protein
MMRVLALGCVLASGQAFAAAADLGSQVAAGKQLFETTCAASTCHGSGGVGATAPKLVDRNFSLEAVRTAVSEGRAGTAMPAFKELLAPDMMASVVAYVLSISTGGRWATAVPVERGAETTTPQAAWPDKVAVGEGYGSPAVGYALFYDATRFSSCRTCHSYRENGGPVGPDFAALPGTPMEIFEIVSKPGAANAEYPQVAVKLRDGAVYSGVRHAETDDVVRIVDVSALPPVTRSFLKAEIAAIEPVEDAAFFDHAGLGYTPQELRDAAAFLGVGR